MFRKITSTIREIEGYELTTELTDAEFHPTFYTQHWADNKLTIKTPENMVIELTFTIYSDLGISFRKICKAFTKLEDAEYMYLLDNILGELSGTANGKGIFYDTETKGSWTKYHKVKEYRSGIRNADYMAALLAPYIAAPEPEPDPDPIPAPAPAPADKGMDYHEVTDPALRGLIELAKLTDIVLERSREEN